VPRPAAPEEGQPGHLRASWNAFCLVLEDYHWITKLIAIALVLCCLLGAGVAYWGEGLLLSRQPALERLLVSDAFRMLLTLVFALLIAVSIKRRQNAGLLDGDEHYSIGRALAFGYFKNFLVGTLMLAREKQRTLYIFKPASVQDLRRFEHEVWPEIVRRMQTRTEDIGAVAHARREPLTRRVVVIEAARSGDEEFWMDFPTTLFTVGDYYESWNRWLTSNHKPAIHPTRLLRFEQQQIDEFFRHLRLLMTSDIGGKATAEFGLAPAELAQLQQQHFVELSLPEFRARLETANPAPASP